MTMHRPRRRRKIIALFLFVAALCGGCARHTLLVVDPYITAISPNILSKQSDIGQQIRYRQTIDLFTADRSSALAETLPMLIDDGGYRAVVATPFHAPQVREIAELYPAISFWQLGGLESAIGDNYYTLTFDRQKAMEAMAEYISDEYPDFDAEFLFLFRPNNDADYALVAQFEQALIQRQLSFELERIENPNATVLSPHIQQINGGRYDAVGLFLGGHNHLVYDQLAFDDVADVAIITEHIGDDNAYERLPSIAASIEYDYRKGLRRILAVIRRDNSETLGNIILDADLMLYK